MRKETVDDKTITVFDDIEEAKWHFHKLYCRNPSAFYYLEVVKRCITFEEANKALKPFSARVSTLEELLAYEIEQCRSEGKERGYPDSLIEGQIMFLKQRFENKRIEAAYLKKEH